MSQPPGNSLPPPFPSMPFSPVYYPPPPRPPRQRGGFVLSILNSLAVTAFFVSIFFNFYLLRGQRPGGLDQTTLTDGDSDHVIAVIPVDGTILEPMVENFDAALKAVEADHSVKAVILKIDSPGGSVTASDEMYAKVLKFKKERGIPVIASIGALGTSGGYYLACAADKIVAQRTTWTGNIGVLLPRYNIAELANKYGIKETTLHSTGSDFKDAGSMWKNDTPAQTAYWQDLVDQAFVSFKQVVHDGRGLDPATVDRIANGKVYSGPEAKRLELVDQIGYFDDAVALAADQAKLGSVKPKVVEFEQSKSLLASLGARGDLGSNVVSARVGLVNLEVDRGFLESLAAPRPMYLWQGR